MLFSSDRLSCAPVRSGKSDTAIGQYQLQQNALVPLLAQTVCLNLGLSAVKDAWVPARCESFPDLVWFNPTLRLWVVSHARPLNLISCGTSGPCCSGFKTLDGETVSADRMKEVICLVCAIKPLCAWNLQVGLTMATGLGLLSCKLTSLFVRQAPALQFVVRWTPAQTVRTHMVLEPRRKRRRRVGSAVEAKGI